MRVRGVVGRNLTAPTGSSILSNILGQVCNSGQFLGCGERNIFNPEWHTLHSNSWIRNDLWNICLGRVWIKRKTMNQLNYNNPGSDLLYFLSPVFNFSTCKNTLMPGSQQRVGGGVVYLNIRISSICTISHDQIRMSLTSWFDDNLKRRLIRLQNRDLRNIKRWCILTISPIHTSAGKVQDPQRSRNNRAFGRKWWTYFSNRRSIPRKGVFLIPSRDGLAKRPWHVHS